MSTLFEVAFVAYLVATGADALVRAIVARRIEAPYSKGETATAYCAGLRLLHILTLPLVSLFFRRRIDHLLRDLSLLAEALEDIPAAITFAARSLRAHYSPTKHIEDPLDRLAVLLRQENRVEEARRITDVLLAVSADSPILQLPVLLKQGHLQQVLRFFDAPTALTDYYAADITALFIQFRVDALRCLGRYDEAIAVRDAHTVGLDDLMNSLCLRLEAGQFDAARNLWAKRLPTEEDFSLPPLCDATHAWLCAVSGEPSKAYRLIRRAQAAQRSAESEPIFSRDLVGFPEESSIEPYYITTRFNVCQRTAIDCVVARAYIALQDDAAAIDTLNALIPQMRMPLQQAESRSLLADCYQRTRQWELARQCYEQVIAAQFDEAAFTEHARAHLPLLNYSEQPSPLPTAVNA